MTTPEPPARRPRIIEVAAAAGVSITTVSHALNGKGRIADATRTHVERVAVELGYRPATNARSLGRGRHGLLALKVSTPDDGAASFVEFDYFRRLLNAATSTALQNGFALVTLPSGGGDKPPPYIEADGMIAIDPEYGDEALAIWRQRGLPIVTTGRATDDDGSSWIDNDHRNGTIAVLDHLAASGAKRISLIGPDRETSFKVDAAAAYLEWCASESTEPTEWTGVSDYSEAVGRRAALELLSGPNPPDAIYALIDSLGIGVLSAARELGVEVPGQLLVAAGADSAAAAGGNPALTSTALAPEEIGAGAVEMLLEMLDDPSTPVANRFVPTKLVIRESSSPAA
jgi:DNA-binding LacI/PurR family transcriptional regulator